MQLRASSLLRAIAARRWASPLGAILVALAMTATIAGAARHHSPTLDEPGHLVRGLAFWWTPDRAMHWPHPPLGQAVVTVGAAVDGWDHRERLDLETNDFRKATYRYAEADYADMRSELLLGRYGMAVLAGLMALVLFFWARRWYDDATAWLSLLLYASNTTLLAHGGLVTTDFPIAAATLIAVMAVNRHLHRRSRLNLPWVALAVALLAVVKLSGLLLALLLALPVIWVASQGVGPYAGLSPAARLGRLVLEGLAVLAAVVLAINAVYLFRDSGLTVAEIIARDTPSHWFDDVDILGRGSFIDALPEGLPIPLPWSYLYSVDFILTQSAAGHGGWVFGQGYGFVPGYHALMLAVKTPAGTLGLIVLGVVLAMRLGHEPKRDEPSGETPSGEPDALPSTTWLLAYAVVAFLISTIGSRIYLGVRHALPAVPLIVLLAGRAGALALAGDLRDRHGEIALATGSRAHRAARALVVVCVVGNLLGAAASYPRYIADFNILVGGRAGGHHISIVGEDWGQDLQAFADYAKDEDLGPFAYVKTVRMRQMELDHLGLTYDPIRCPELPEGAAEALAKHEPVDLPPPAPLDRTVVIHLDSLMREEECFHWLGGLNPSAVIHDHILVFRPDAVTP